MALALEKQDMLNAELRLDLQQEVIESFNDLLISFDSDKGSSVSFGESLKLYAERTELLALTMASAELPGLMDACQIFQKNLHVLQSEGRMLNQQEMLLIADWPCLLISYFDDPSRSICVDAIVDYLMQLPWSEEKLSLEEADILRELLTTTTRGDNSTPIVSNIAVNTSASDLESQATDHLDNNLQSSDLTEVIHIPSIEDPVDTHARTQDEPVNANDEPSAQITLPDAYRELVTLVDMEIEASLEDLSRAIDIAANPQEVTDTRKEALKLYQEKLNRFSAASDSVGLGGLSEVLGYIVTNLNAQAESGETLNSTKQDWINKWPMLLKNYIAHLGKPLAGEEMVTHLQSSPWENGLCGQSSPHLIQLLASPTIITDEEDAEPRQTEAQIEDVTLQLPEEVNQQLLDTLLQELPTQTADLTVFISRIANGSADLKDVAVANRIAHTLKGSANTVGVVGLATLTHHIEDILEAFTKHERMPGQQLADALLNAADVLEMMSEFMLGMGPKPEQAQSVLQSLLDWGNLIDQKGIPDDSEIDVLGIPTENASKESVVQTDDKQQSEGNKQPEDKNAIPMLRIPTTVVDELLRLIGETTILNGQLHERLRQAKLHTESVHEQNVLFQQLTYELEQLVDVQGLTSTQFITDNHNTSSNGKSDQFDALEFDQYNELHTVTHRLVEAATDSKEMTQGIEDQLTALDDLLVDQSRLHRENQEVVMRTRMVPVQNIVPRLQRSVRQTCRQTNKQAELIVTGADTLIDSDVLDELMDPLMHIMRNAIDHGIESPNTRETLGKPVIGRLSLSFAREGEHITVRCEDDGAGLDATSIRDAAIDAGLLSSDQESTPEEISRLILVPGFTTRKNTTQVSGRGIGMDVVYSRIMSMKGTLDILSTPGNGCSVEFRLPLTLISIHALLAQSRNQTLSISSRGVEQIIYPGAGTLQKEGKLYVLGDQQYELCDIESLLGLASDLNHLACQEKTILLVRSANNKLHAVAVDEVRATQDLVLKQLGPFVPETMGVAGATILGDGSVAPVLDLPELLRATTQDKISPTFENNSSLERESNLPIAMVVDDSLSARRSLAEFMTDSGYEVITARDGMEAIDLIQQRQPDILLADLEMPRMNGLELSSHVRSNQATKHIPVIMITSRSTEKHRQQAYAMGVNVYLTKPFSEDVLLEHVESELRDASKEIVENGN